MKRLFLVLASVEICLIPADRALLAGQPHVADTDRPNVLFIAVDDLNDWVGCLGGHPQAKTPSIDRLAGRGVLFRNAHCTTAYCNPSRTSVLIGLRPSASGIYDNPQRWTRAPRLENVVTLPQHFRGHGYRAVRGGKIFHSAHPPSWDEHFPSEHQFKPHQAVATGQDFNRLADQIGRNGKRRLARYRASLSGNRLLRRRPDWPDSGRSGRRHHATHRRS